MSQTWLSEAARKFGVSKATIQYWIRCGRIRAEKYADLLLVDEEEVGHRVREMRTQQMAFASQIQFRGEMTATAETISLSEAARKYAIPHSTIHEWAKRGQVRKIGTVANRVLVLEDDIRRKAAGPRHRGRPSKARVVLTT